MKKLIYTAFVICGMLTASCSDLLNLESKTDVTNNYLFTTPEGLNTAVTGLYSLARELPGGADNNESNLYIVTMCDFNTDIAILRAGVSTSIGRLNTSFTPSTGDVNKFWKHHYGIIGKANEIIVAAEALGLDDSDVLHAWSEAKFFRGRSQTAGGFITIGRYDYAIQSNRIFFYLEIFFQCTPFLQRHIPSDGFISHRTDLQHKITFGKILQKIMPGSIGHSSDGRTFQGDCNIG